MSGAVARRYAQALFELSQEKGITTAVEADLQGLTGALGSFQELKAVMANPRVSARDKKALINTIMGAEIHPITRNFLFLVIDKGREQSFEGIYKQFGALSDEAQGIRRLEITTAIELSQEDLAGIIGSLEEQLGQKLSVESRVDPSIKGGLVIRSGDLMIDGSIVTRLQRLKARMMMGATLDG